MEKYVLIVLLICWLICGFIAAAIGGRKGEGCGAFFIGFLFGPLGIIIAICSSGNRRPCPFCKEKIHPGSTICKHCRGAVKL